MAYMTLFESFDRPYEAVDNSLLGPEFPQELETVSRFWFACGYRPGIAAYLNFFLLRDFIVTHDDASPPRFRSFKSMADSFYQTDLFIRDVTDSGQKPTGGISSQKVRGLLFQIMARYQSVSIPLWMMTYFGFSLLENVEKQAGNPTAQEKQWHLQYMAKTYRIMGRLVIKQAIGAARKAVPAQAAVGLLMLLAGIPSRAADYKSPLPIPSIPAVNQIDYLWSLQSLDDVNHPMSEFEGHVLLINYWATWCGPCRAEMPSIAHLAERLKGEPIDVLCLTGESPTIVRRWLEKNPIAIPIYTYVGLPPTALQVLALPMTYVVNRTGQIIYLREGAAKWDDPGVIKSLMELAH